MSHKIYGQQVLVIGSGENPYIATTDLQMQSYLNKNYLGSFVKYKTDRYLNQSTQVPLSCRSKTPTTGAVDMALGSPYVSAKIDEWLPEPGMVKIASIETFNHSQTFRGEAIPYSLREYFDIYAYKYKNTDGSYTRALLYGFVQLLILEYSPSSSATWRDNGAYFTLLYVDNLTEEAGSAMGQLSITMIVDSKTYPLELEMPPVSGKITINDVFNPMGFMEYAVPNKNNYADYWGKYASDDSSSDAGILGVSQISWATYLSSSWNSINYPRCTYLYKDASIIFASINSIPESQRLYKDNCTYIINSTQKTRTIWQAESPIVQGDTLAGATYYFNQQITHKEYADLCGQLIPSSQRTDDDAEIYYFYNVDNPYYTIGNFVEEMVKSLPLLDFGEDENILLSYLFYPSNIPHNPINPIAVGDVLTRLYFAQDITPDFALLDWSNAIEEGGVSKLVLMAGEKVNSADETVNYDLLVIGKISAGTELEGYTFTKDNYILRADALDNSTIYITEEYAQLAETKAGWQVSYCNINNVTVTSVSQQDIWGKYISKDGDWESVSGDASNIFLFGEEPTDTSTITLASVVVPTSYTYADDVVTVPATVGKVNMPLITNGLIGKTANFTSVTENYDDYYFTQVLTLGNLFTEGTEARMDALLGDPSSNDGIMENRLYMYTGETTNKYTQGSLYILTTGGELI